MQWKENDRIVLLKLTESLNAIKIIRDKKKYVDKYFIFDCLTKSLASKLELELLGHVLVTLTENNQVIYWKNLAGLNFFLHS